MAIKSKREKLTLKKVLNINEGLAGILERTDLEAVLSYKLGKLKKDLEFHLEPYNEAVTKERKKYEVEKDGRQIIPNDKIDVFTKAIEKIQAQEVEIEFPSIKFSEFPKYNPEELKAHPELKNVQPKFWTLIGDAIEFDA